MLTPEDSTHHRATGIRSAVVQCPRAHNTSGRIRTADRANARPRQPHDFSPHGSSLESELRLSRIVLIVVEGLHALHDLVREQVDIAVFVEAPRDARWARAVSREQAGERPWPVAYLEHFFCTVAEPTFALHAERYRTNAHFVVRNA